MFRDLTGLLTPKSVAIIGASESPKKVGAIALKNIIDSGYLGNVYPINPNVAQIGSLKFYPNVASLPEVPDLAVVAIPASLVINELEECGKLGIKNVVIFSAGFKEIGENGKQLEEKLLEVADKYQLNILGPNCLGFASTNPPLNVTFGQIVKTQGKVNIISQSGALATSLFDWCQSLGLGFNSVITVGNKSVINENDILNYWSNDDLPIGLYLESITSGQEFIKIISKITPKKPVFILKPGKSVAAAAAMSSHTGSIAGENRVVEAALEEVGVIHCQELEDFFDLIQAFGWGKIPMGPQVAIISNAGGPAVLATDAVVAAGLEMAKLTGANPVDVLGDALADKFADALEKVLQEKTAQSVLVILTPQLMTEVQKTAEIVAELSKKYDLPIFCSFVGGSEVDEGRRILNQEKIPNYVFPERAIKAIAVMWKWQNQRTKTPPAFGHLPPQGGSRDLTGEAQKINKNILAALGDKNNDELLKAMNIPVPTSKIVISNDEAISFAKENGWPVVLKLIAPQLLHKAEVGGVKINIRTEAELVKAMAEMNNKVVRFGALIQIQKQIMGGVEVIVGIKRDPTFGPVMLFGAGGKYAEFLDDYNLSLCPLSVEKAKQMVEKSKVFKLLNGFRDDSQYDLGQLYEVMVGLSRLAVDYPEIKEMEINPLIITHQGAWAVDPKVILR